MAIHNMCPTVNKRNLLAIGAVLVSGTGVLGQTANWLGNTNNLWTTSTNWTPAFEPSSNCLPSRGEKTGTQLVFVIPASFRDSEHVPGTLNAQLGRSQMTGHG